MAKIASGSTKNAKPIASKYKKGAICSRCGNEGHYKNGIQNAAFMCHLSAHFTTDGKNNHLIAYVNAVMSDNSKLLASSRR